MTNGRQIVADSLKENPNPNANPNPNPNPDPNPNPNPNRRPHPQLQESPAGGYPAESPAGGYPAESPAARRTRLRMGRRPPEGDVGGDTGEI